MARKQSLQEEHEREVHSRQIAKETKQGREYAQDHPLDTGSEWIKDIQDFLFGKKMEFPEPPTPPALYMPRPIQPVRRRSNEEIRHQESFNPSAEKLRDQQRSLGPFVLHYPPARDGSLRHDPEVEQYTYLGFPGPPGREEIVIPHHKKLKDIPIRRRTK